MLEVKPLEVKDPKVKQPPYPLRGVPANSLHIGPCGSGESIADILTLFERHELGAYFDAYYGFSFNVWGDIINRKCWVGTPRTIPGIHAGLLP